MLLNTQTMTPSSRPTLNCCCWESTGLLFSESDPFCKCEIHSQPARALSLTFPFLLSEVKDLRRAWGGLQGQSLFLLGTCFLLGAGCLQKTACFGERLGVGHIFNSVKKQLVWIYFHSCLELPSSQTHEGEDLSRGASSMKNLPSITVVLYACCFCGIVEFADCQRGASFYVVNSVWNLSEPLYGEPCSNNIFKLKLLWESVS